MGGPCDYSEIKMNFFAKWNSLWPFTVNVSGKKAKLINSIGKAIAPKANQVDPFGITISTKNHACASIIRYAPYNFFYDFHKSNLGIFMTLECHENDVFVDVGANLGGYSFMAKRLGLNVYAFEPFPEIAAFLIENGEIKKIINKKTLPNYGVFDEKRNFEADNFLSLIEFRGMTLAVLICEDAWDSKNLFLLSSSCCLIPI